LGGLVVLVAVILTIPQMAALNMFDANTSSNLTSSGQGLSEFIPIFGLIIGVGVFGFIVQKR